MVARDEAPPRWPVGLCLALGLVARAAQAAGDHGAAYDRARLTGHVIDARTGKPLADAKVSFVRQAPKGGIDITNRRTDEAACGPDGRFEITSLAGGTYLVSTRAAGYGVAYGPAVRLEEGGSRKDLQLPVGSGASLEGVVLTHGGEPLADAWVVAQSPMRSAFVTSPMGEEPVATARSDARGRFALKGLSSSYVNVTVTHASFAPGGLRGVSVGAPASRSVEVRLRRPGGLRGEVYRRRRPVPEVTVGVGGHGAPTDQDGAFDLRQLAPGRVNVTVSGWPPNGSSFSYDQEFLIREGETQTVRIDVPSQSFGLVEIFRALLDTYRRTRRDKATRREDGGPFPMAGVVKLPNGDPAFPALVALGQRGQVGATDAEGRFSFSQEGGTFDVVAWMPGWGPGVRRSVRIGVGAPRVELTLTPQAFLRLSVARGKEPVAGAQVSSEGLRLDSWDFETDAEGVSFYDSLPEGERFLRVSSGGKAWEKRVKLVAGAVSDLAIDLDGMPPVAETP